jgi:hypothetical protein
LEGGLHESRNRDIRQLEALDSAFPLGFRITGVDLERDYVAPLYLSWQSGRYHDQGTLNVGGLLVRHADRAIVVFRTAYGFQRVLVVPDARSLQGRPD